MRASPPKGAVLVQFDDRFLAVFGIDEILWVE